MNEARSSGSPGWTGFWGRWGSLTCGSLLAAVTLAVYWPVTGFDFVNFDDPAYVTDNPYVQTGISWEGLRWAFHTLAWANWHPLTWLSHQLDCQLYGLKAGGHHLTSLLLHVANSCLLFTLLWQTTRRRWASLVVAALFAWHPAHVESVAWIAERKDVLSTCFGLMALWAYARYAEQSRVQSPWVMVRNPWSPVHLPSSCYYALALVLFALGLMSKPMLVTLPFVMLLLDYWPLGRMAERGARSAELGMGPGRFRLARWRRLLLEKAPFLLLAGLSCWVTLRAQSAFGAVSSMEDMPLKTRIANAVLSYGRYLGETLWPVRLAVFYPHSRPSLTWPVLLAGGLLLGVSAGAVWLRRAPSLAVGWLWYLGTLLPVIGLVQVGAQAMADRYLYLPSVGLFILGSFGMSDLAGCFRQRMAGTQASAGRPELGLAGWAACGAAGLALAACLVATRHQLWYWRNSEDLFRHTIAVTRNNVVACNNLGVALFNQGRTEEAFGYYQQALRYAPIYPDAHCNLGDYYAARKQRRAAITEYEAGLKVDPKRPRVQYALANQLLAEGDLAGALEHYQAALDLDPQFPEAHYQMAVLLQTRNEVDAATRHLREALRLKPDWVEALNNLAWQLATQPDARLRDGPQAVELAARAVALSRTNNAGLLDTLGAALAATGRFPEALDAARTAARLAQASGAAQLGREIEAHRQGYERRQPVRELSAPEPKGSP